jgi:magnesium chelatase family protein
VGTTLGSQPARPQASGISRQTRRRHVITLTRPRTAFVSTRPFRTPRHTTADVGLIGGGQVPLPGEVSRAHQGVLCLDELPECKRHVLEVLRQLLKKSFM